MIEIMETMDRIVDHLIQGYQLFNHMEDIYEKIDDDTNATVVINGLGTANNKEELEQKLELVFLDMSNSMGALLKMSHMLKHQAKGEQKFQISDILACAEKLRLIYVEEFGLDNN